jgi:glycine/serine hydroxymethyltransferase
MGIAEMAEIVEMIDTVLQSPRNERVLKRVRSRVKGLCRRFPLFAPG